MNAHFFHVDHFYAQMKNFLFDLIFICCFFLKRNVHTTKLTSIQTIRTPNATHFTLKFSIYLIAYALSCMCFVSKTNKLTVLFYKCNICQHYKYIF